MNDLGLGIIVSMKDAFTQNAQRIQSSMQSLDATVAAASERMTRNLDRIQKGTMLIGAGLATLALPAALVASTVATQRALAEMASLGTKDLRTLEDAAESFTNQWAGFSKAEFIGAAYDVKSALANLSDEAVGTFAGMAALTAKATKASIQEMVGTFTVGYGIFKPLMSDMSDMEWAKTFSGAMAQTVAAFKTTGPQMAEAIKNIGALAASANVPLQEQLAILGQLQTTMPGSEAGTLYKAFMMKAAEAGQELGLEFVNSTGQLKGVTDILREIQGLYPDLSQAAAQVKLKKAFGSDEALKFVLQMSSGMESLESNIQGIEKAMRSGTATTEEMARAMNLDIGSQMLLLKQQIANLAEILGRTLLPVIIPVIQGVSKMVLGFQNVARRVPGLTRVVLGLTAALGMLLVGAGTVMAAVGLIGVTTPALSAGFSAIGAAAAGVGATIAAWFWPVTAVIAGLIGSVWLLKQAWSRNLGGMRDAVLDVWNRVSFAFQGIRALVTSLNGGVGQMSAELAGKLESAGLMKFVVTVFRTYYRIREYLAGLSEAFSRSFGRVRAILEPAVRSLVAAYGSLYQALFSVFEVFGLVSTAADGSTFRTLGTRVGTVLSVLVQIGAFLLRGILNNLARMVRILSVVVRVAVGMGKILIGTFVTVGQFIWTFLLPVRLLGQAFLAVGRIVYAFWRIFTGDGSVLSGLQSIGKAVFDFLLTPFRWAWDVVTGYWALIRRIFGAMGDLVSGLASRVGQAFLNLPVVAGLRQVFGTVREFLSGDLGFFEAGKRLVMRLGEGIWSAATYPYQILRKALGKLRDLLPFSDAKEGPLSVLTASGAALLRTFAQGMRLSTDLPRRVFSGVVQSLRSSLGSAGNWVREKGQAVLKGGQDLWSGLSGRAQALAGRVSGAVSSRAAGLWGRLKGGVAGATQTLRPFGPGLPSRTVPFPVERPAYVPASGLSGILQNLMPRWEIPFLPALPGVPLLAGAAGQPSPVAMGGQSGDSERGRFVEFQKPGGSFSREASGGASGESIRPFLEALFAKLDALAERPISLTVTTRLNGRQIAEAVYKDLREQRIRNYETL